MDLRPMLAVNVELCAAQNFSIAFSTYVQLVSLGEHLAGTGEPVLHRALDLTQNYRTQFHAGCVELQIGDVAEIHAMLGDTFLRAIAHRSAINRRSL